jgi:tRNA(Met) cytidine acetyltransferase
VIFDVNPWENWFQSANNGVFHRHLLVLSGSQHWTYKKALKIVQDCNEKSLWLGDDAFFTVRGFPTKQYGKLLGKECKVAVFDGHKGVSPSAFLALAGTISAGGILVLCCPTWCEWKTLNNYVQGTLVSHGFKATDSKFIERWQNLIVENEGITVFREESNQAVCPPPSFSNPATTKTIPSPFASSDQQRAYSSIMSDDSSLDTIITARRGRGKSALLGLLASARVNQGRKITLCTAHKYNADGVFSFLQRPSDVEWLPRF